MANLLRKTQSNRGARWMARLLLRSVRIAPKRGQTHRTVIRKTFRMENLNYVALSAQMALRRRMDVIANNIANADTAGFKEEAPIFASYLQRLEGDNVRSANAISFVLDRGTGRDFSTGQIVPTGNPLDIALSDNTFLSVRLPTGDTAYTRNGHLRRSEDGFLVTSAGERVLDANGNDIQLTADDNPLEIAKDGALANANGPRGRLQLVRFDDLSQLRNLGGSLLEGPGAQQIPAGTQAVQTGAYESSNVQPVAELVKMIEVVRTYQSANTMIDKYDELRRRALDRLSRIQ
ncbi:flagellar basal-body rod protein FlgF [Hankyongella ginsenosidimutans]|uniref:Flagellar basal-body rod protein FlgF n=2 Tax=Hankyongella ginsenosidimutans TaxID=1763828 RepID=A0A4D7CCC0_9SPHN|nr:flagellar basal-body rod protein FlgF [Hankyongella ginsenosidimutans]